MKKAFITGVTGQDGSYLAEFLLNKGYQVHGLIRRSSRDLMQRIEHLLHDPHEKFNNFFIHYGDVTDSSNITHLIQKLQPDEIYNLAAQSHVKISFETPEYTANSDSLGALRILEAIRVLGMEAKTKFYQASTSELYGKVAVIPQDENTPFYPRSPYAAAKLYAYWVSINYREAYNIFASNGILFNHESPRRGNNFVTKKIIIGVAEIFAGKRKCLYLGNIDAKRDWGYAPDYVDAMWRIMQYDKPDEFVVATNETHSVKEFIEKSFSLIDINIVWEGQGVNEKGINKKNNQTIISIDPLYFRPTEVDYLQGDYSKAKKLLGWQPTVRFDELVEIMMKAELNNLKK
ncbi:MAG: GDP-mannose 4,6-dehydratase [Bacteroidales bacterium]|nr:GDP-mannose 4,6-dehydratase [Bacteroidales bacterium]